ncbi:MAG: Mrr restriction system protein [Anaerolineales bacterium]|nr:MAG: Mrr restriction system protein [Anaerolineales bacterium]
MQNTVNLQRISELVRAVLELLWNRPGGLPAREIIAYLPQITTLTTYEREYTPPSNMPRYERYVRLATIPLVKAGWLVKSNKGRWYITEEGREACQKFQFAQEFYNEALKSFEENRLVNPGIIAEVEQAEEKAWEQIQNYIQGFKRREFQLLTVDLLVSLDYHILWAAPPDKERGQIDIIATTDPLGTRDTRIFVQIRHADEPIHIKGLQTFQSSIGTNSHGVLISTSGFTQETIEKMGESAQSKITLVDLEAFFDLWVKCLSKHSHEAVLRFPLRPVYFLSGAGTTE